MGMLTLTKPTMTETEILDAIQAKAIALWGDDRWLTDLTRKYNELHHEDGDTVEAYRRKRPTLGRLFDGGNPGLETVIKLAQCVELKVSIG
jgi:hypothetical protein